MWKLFGIRHRDNDISTGITKLQLSSFSSVRTSSFLKIQAINIIDAIADVQMPKSGNIKGIVQVIAALLFSTPPATDPCGSVIFPSLSTQVK